MLHKRTSYVGDIHILSLDIASNLEIGDTTMIESFARVLALQREEEIFYSNEGDFSQYNIFIEPVEFQPISENIFFESTSTNPFINVKKLNVKFVSTTSVIQIGSNKQAYMESRIKHIRQLKQQDN